MSEASLAPARGAIGRQWDAAVASLTRPYRVTVPMVLMMLLVPCYIFIAERMPGRPAHAPALAWDRALPLRPAWALVYGCLYLFLIVLPVLVVREEELIRRTVLAYLVVWIAAYVCFLAWPTAAPRPIEVGGGGFAVWGLRFLYSADPPYNCFPSLHVAHSFVSALAVRRVNRGVGTAALAAASLVALSTLFTKQHYVVDVAAGVLLAGAAWVIFLRSAPPDAPDADRRAAPALAALVLAGIAAALLGFWIAYRAGARI
jgi:membrane-associated phospholipid phosphatase